MPIWAERETTLAVNQLKHSLKTIGTAKNHGYSHNQVSIDTVNLPPGDLEVTNPIGDSKFITKEKQMSTL